MLPMISLAYAVADAADCQRTLFRLLPRAMLPPLLTLCAFHASFRAAVDGCHYALCRRHAYDCCCYFVDAGCHATLVYAAPSTPTMPDYFLLIRCCHAAFRH
jgi:hypothetical protein